MTAHCQIITVATQTSTNHQQNHQSVKTSKSHTTWADGAKTSTAKTIPDSKTPHGLTWAKASSLLLWGRNMSLSSIVFFLLTQINTSASDTAPILTGNFRYKVIISIGRHNWAVLRKWKLLRFSADRITHLSKTPKDKFMASASILKGNLVLVLTKTAKNHL